jgi:hypothetical protein
LLKSKTKSNFSPGTPVSSTNKTLQIILDT